MGLWKLPSQFSLEIVKNDHKYLFKNFNLKNSRNRTFSDQVKRMVLLRVIVLRFFFSDSVSFEPFKKLIECSNNNAAFSTNNSNKLNNTNGDYKLKRSTPYNKNTLEECMNIIKT